MPDMPNTIEESLDTHAAVGPLGEMYGHDAVCTVDASLLVCLHCGYTTEQYVRLMHTECDVSENDIQTRWDESVAENGFPMPDD